MGIKWIKRGLNLLSPPTPSVPGLGRMLLLGHDLDVPGYKAGLSHC